MFYCCSKLLYTVASELLKNLEELLLIVVSESLTLVPLMSIKS